MCSPISVSRLAAGTEGSQKNSGPLWGNTATIGAGGGRALSQPTEVAFEPSSRCGSAVGSSDVCPSAHRLPPSCRLLGHGAAADTGLSWWRRWAADASTVSTPNTGEEGEPVNVG